MIKQKISLKFVNRKNHKVSSFLLVQTYAELEGKKTLWTKTCKKKCPSNHHWLWILCLPSLLLDCGTLIFKWKVIHTLSKKVDFGPAAFFPVATYNTSHVCPGSGATIEITVVALVLQTFVSADWKVIFELFYKFNNLSSRRGRVDPEPSQDQHIDLWDKQLHIKLSR